MNTASEESGNRADVQTPAAAKVPASGKLAYGLGTTNDMWGSWLYPSIVWPVYNIFLHVSPSLVSLALIINRLADVFADPLVGWWSDNTRSKWGRRRPFILVGSILAGLLLAMFALARFGLTPHKMEEIRAKLEARRGTV